MLIDFKRKKGQKKKTAHCPKCGKPLVTSKKIGEEIYFKCCNITYSLFGPKKK